MSDLPRSPSPGYGPAHYARHDLYRCDHGKNISRSFECWGCCLRKAMKNKKEADDWVKRLRARIEEAEHDELRYKAFKNHKNPDYSKRYDAKKDKLTALKEQKKDQPFKAYGEAWKEYNKYFPDVKVTYCADRLSVRRESDGKVFHMD